jgi:hypothetical protein
MKIFRISCLSVVLALPTLALAKLPLPNEIFGRIESSLDYCAQVDSKSAPKYQERKKVLVRGVSDQEVSEARASKEYQEAYDQVNADLAKEPKDQTAKACAASLESGKQA